LLQVSFSAIDLWIAAISPQTSDTSVSSFGCQYVFGRNSNESNVASKSKLEARMPEPDDPFTGTWRFNPERSTLSTPPPQSWVQQIIATSDEVHVHEIIIRPDGSQTIVEVMASFDGSAYPVTGSPAADSIVYRRVSSNSISGTGKKNGAVTLMETVTVTPESRTLTLSYSIHSGAHVVAHGIAVFEKDAG
jgi:hypothetical protein